tara:strand:- start:652 stop:897 length:246 start_codon:yes stop_codon:yes gene_type:complete
LQKLYEDDSLTDAVTGKPLQTGWMEYNQFRVAGMTSSCGTTHAGETAKQRWAREVRLECVTCYNAAPLSSEIDREIQIEGS